MNHHILYHEEKGMILFLTPKSGNTSFRASIVRAMGAQLGGEESYGFRWITPKEAYAIKDDNPDVRAVAFVRNPIDRTLSAWKNKILPLEPRGCRVPGWGDHIKGGCTFAEYLDGLSKTDLSTIDMHARPQLSDMVVDGVFIPDITFRLEDVIRDIDLYESYFESYFGINVGPLGVHNATNVKYHLTRDEKDSIIRIYSEDYNEFYRR